MIRILDLNNLNLVTRKYAKLVLNSIKKDAPDQIIANCPLCGDRRHRLSIAAVKDDIGVARCFNAGCPAENGMPFPVFLKMMDESLFQQYRKEKFDYDLGLDKPKDLNHLLKPKKVLNINLPDVFRHLEKLIDIPEAVEYVKNRCVPESYYKNWYFSKDAFIKVLDKNYYVKNFIFIPIIQNEKLSGFYTRSIEEKRFSTILFPNAEKYWATENLNKNEKVFITEGIFDAIATGYENIVAMLSASLPDFLIDELKTPIFILDNDKTGIEKALNYVQGGYNVFIWVDEWEKYKDLNEVLCDGISRSKIRNIIENNIYNGLEAEIRINLKNV